MLSQEVKQALESKGLLSEYTEYKNERHGFDRIETKIDSLKKETEFILKVIDKG